MCVFEHADHAAAPWHLVAGNQKKWARIAMLETTIKRIEHRRELWNSQ